MTEDDRFDWAESRAQKMKKQYQQAIRYWTAFANKMLRVSGG